MRVLLIEDNALLREGIVALIKSKTNINMRASNGDDDVIRKVMEWKPHVVLMDLGIEHQDSLELMNKIQQILPDTSIILMDLLPSQIDVYRFVQAGASGFILKNATLQDFTETIHSVARGEKVLPKTMAGSLFSQIAQYAVRSGKVEPTDAIRMTRREKEIIQLIGEGLSNKEIAQRLHIATFTVKSHVHNILEKLALRTRLQIAAYVHSEKRNPGKDAI